jgi:hypothetical protein
VPEAELDLRLHRLPALSHFRRGRARGGCGSQQFYLGSLLVTGLVMWVLWWYMSSGRRLVEPDLSLQAIRRHHIISAGVPASVLLLMVLVTMGVGRLVNPLLLA